MKIKCLTNFSNTFYGNFETDDIKVVDDDHGLQFIELGVAEELTEEVDGDPLNDNSADKAAADKAAADKTAAAKKTAPKKGAAK